MSRREGPARAPGDEVAGGLRRRAVLRAGAWAVPAVTVVAAVPAYAASVPVAPSPQLLMTFRRDESWSIYVTLVLPTPLDAGASLVVRDLATGARWRLSGVTAPIGWVGGWPTDETFHFAYTASVPSEAGSLDFIVGRSGGWGVDGGLRGVTATLFGADGTPLVTAGPPTMLG
ncbi:hypothetical protein [Nocardioides zeae]|uniref:Uncharacterized protein n=1 Tax=Nocardioides zeae TaxID=1457234 RepID=A0A6P0HMJ7_9ACTN|nr:hypothetical protein [Nocardioides zeae]NEN79816.1 hypothetical protein [Nocardioides zeae]